MNGIGLFLLMVATTAQVGATSTERDYGWQVADDGALEYIIQISPDKLRLMQQKSVAYPNGQETESYMPPQLVGRVTRVIVRIGEGDLPRSPSLQELERLPRIGDTPPQSSAALQLGPGNYSEVESNLHNVQGNGQPSLPNLPNANENLIDQAARATGNIRDNAASALSRAADALSLPDNSQASSPFLNSTRGKYNSLPNVPLPNDNAANNNLANVSPNLNTNLPSLPNTTANNPYASGTIGNSSQLNKSALNNNSNLNLPDTRTGQLNNGQLNNDQLNYGQLSNGLPSLNLPTGLPQQQTPATGFGTSPGRQNQSYITAPGMTPLPNNNPGAYSNNSNLTEYQRNVGTQTGIPSTSPFATNGQLNNGQLNNGQLNNGQLNNGQLNNGQYSAGSNGNQNYDRLAMNNNLGTGQVVQPIQPAPSTQHPSPSDIQRQGTGTVGAGTTGTHTTATSHLPGGLSQSYLNWLQFFFLVSLIVNFYMGGLLRKLLGRYRLLLMNTRGQMA